MVIVVCRAIDWFAEILIWLLFARAILSWFAAMGGQTIRGIYEFAVQMTEPIVAPIRGFMSRFNTGMLDFSVLIAFFVIRMVATALIVLIQMIF